LAAAEGREAELKEPVKNYATVTQQRREAYGSRTIYKDGRTDGVRQARPHSLGRNQRTDRRPIRA